MAIPTPITFPPELPISQRAEEILAAIKENQVIVLSGETGSGKTTQIPKMCLAAGLGEKRKIACTQPRRVAALSVAKRVAEELNVNFGRDVGAKIRFTDKTTKETRIKFMTDGMLLAEVQSDRRLQEYDTIIIDEAHERSLNIDFLLGHLNKLRKERPDLKVVITSATIDVDKFSKAFDGAPIIEVSGRVYPVDVVYAPLDELLEDSGDFTFIDGIAESVDRIVEEFGSGDILAFLPTEKDIREAMDLLHGRVGKRMTILPCFGRLSNADQQKIFSTSPKRKLILATNIAETSLTIPGIRFVIDAGLARLSRYNPRTRTKRLPIEKVSQSSANQRKGRCGRVADGICIRLYSETDFNKRPVYSIPELQRSNLAEVILRMKASRLGNVETFPFIDPPSPAAIKSGYLLLEELGAIDVEQKLTQLGRKLASLPIDPTVGRMLLQAEDESCVDPALVIASALSIQDPKERPLGKEEAANQAHAKFKHRDSDFLTLLNIWESVHDEVERLSQSKLRKFCKQNFLSYLRMREWKDVYDQLGLALRSRAQKSGDRRQRSDKKSSIGPNSDDPQIPSSNVGSPLAGEKQSLPSNQPNQKVTPNPLKFTYTDQKQKDASRAYGGAEYAAIHHCLITGLLANPARKEETNHYKAGGNRKVMIFPGSTLFNKKVAFQKGERQQGAKPSKVPAPEWILSGEIVETNRLYARNVATIDPSWLVQLGSHIIRRRYSEPIWDPKQGRATVKERLILHGIEIQNKHVGYSKVNPQGAAEIFIRQGLLDEEWEAHYDFLDHNRRLKRRIQNAQTTMQMSSWIGIEESAYRFYATRLGTVSSIHDLNRYLKAEGRRLKTKGKKTLQSKQLQPKHLEEGAYGELHMTDSDLMPEEHEPVDLDAFPASVTLENSALPIDYSYNPGKEDDGVTLKLPYSKAREVDNPMLDWLIPGHLETKIHCLLKALPKDTRRRLPPLAETAKTISKKIRPTGKTLPESLSQYLKSEYKIETYASDWNADAIPNHLKVRLEVEDSKGQVVASARDAQELAQKLDERERAQSKKKDDNTAPLWAKARKRYERPIESFEDLQTWYKEVGLSVSLRSAQSYTPKPTIKERRHPAADQIPSSPKHLQPINLNPSAKGGGIPLIAYPALRKTGDTLRIHLFNTEADALKSNHLGIAALIEHELRYELAWIRKDLKEVKKIGPTLVAFGNIESIMEDTFERIRLELTDHSLQSLDPDAIAQAAAKAQEKSKGFLYKLVDAAKAALELRQDLIVRKDLFPDLRQDIDRLVPKDFIRLTPFWALERLHLYLKIVEKRQKTRPQNPSRDAQREKEVEAFRTQFAQLPQALQSSAFGLKTKWTIEEYALSQHAQELGTAFPISAKRLRAQFGEFASERRHPAAETPKPDPQKTLTPHSSTVTPSKPIDRPTSADLESLKDLFS